MSHCANYLLREGGELWVGNTRWGSKVVPAQVLAGPDGTRTLLAELTGALPIDGEPSETVGWLYREVMTEGAIYADFDARRLRMFGGEDLRGTRLLQLAYEMLLRRAWPGWDARYEPGEWGRIAAEAGVEVGAFDPDDRPLTEFVTLRLADDAVTGLEFYRQPSFQLASVRDARGARHFALSGWGSLLDTQGDVLLAGLSELTPQRLVPRCALADRGLLVDQVDQRVRWWAPRFDAALPPRLAAHWPGFDVAWVDSVVDQVAAAGDDPGPVALPLGLLRELVAEELLRDGSIDALLGDLRARASAPGASVTLAPGVLTAPPAPPDARGLVAALTAGLDPDERLAPRLDGS